MSRRAPEPGAGLDPSEYGSASVERFLDALAAGTPAPGGGAASAMAVALAAGLAAMAARIPGKGGEDRPELVERADAARGEALALTARDAKAYGTVLARYREARTAGDRESADAAVRSALSDAADVPLAVAEIGAGIASLAADLAAHGNPNLRGDAISAVLLAEAGTRSAARLAEINLREAGLEDDPRAASVTAYAESAAVARADVLGKRSGRPDDESDGSHGSSDPA